MIKKKISAIIMALVVTLVPLVASAGDYTSSDPNKNSSFNRTNAKNYAETYGPTYTTPYEGTGSGTANNQYYNFYNDGGDCTNFVSQVLKAGGMSYLGTNRDYSSSWFYNGLYPSYSATWTGAHNFRGHWGNINNSGSNRCYSYKVYTVASALQNWNNIYSYMWEGDVVQYADTNGNTYHSQVVHDFGSNYELYYAQHSTSSGAFYKDGNLKTYLNGRPSNYYFFTYQIKNGA
jgi:hypothetical protein